MKLRNYLFLIAVVVFSACTKATDYLQYVSGQEIIYPGTAQNLNVLPEYNQITFKFNPSPDPKIRRYLILWNYQQDSLTFQATTNSPDSVVRLIVPNLNETELNTFYFYSINENNERSIPYILSNVRCIGNSYLRNLVNRPILSFSAATSNVKKNPMDSIWVVFRGVVDTVNVKTEVYWTDITGASRISQIDAMNSKLLLPKFKINTKVYYLSYYKPTSVGEILYTPVKGKDSVAINQSSF